MVSRFILLKTWCYTPQRASHTLNDVIIKMTLNVGMHKVKLRASGGLGKSYAVDR